MANILMIDNNTLSYNFVARHLKRKGNTITRARSYKRLLHLVPDTHETARQTFDAVLINQLTDLDGDVIDTGKLVNDLKILLPRGDEIQFYLLKPHGITDLGSMENVTEIEPRKLHHGGDPDWDVISLMAAIDEGGL